MSKFTPGPWKLGDGCQGRIYGSGHEYVAVVADTKLERCIADARLIAAAPDMYAALKEAELVIKSVSDGSCLESVLNAIAKAEGKPNE